MREVLVRGQLASLFNLLSMHESAHAEYRRALDRADPQALKADPALLQLRLGYIGNLAVHDALPEARRLLAEFERDTGEALFERGDALAQSGWLARTLVLHASENFKAAWPAAERLLALAERGRLEWLAGDRASGSQRLAAALERLQAGKADPWDLPRYTKLLARSPSAQR